MQERFECLLNKRRAKKNSAIRIREKLLNWIAGVKKKTAKTAPVEKKIP